MDLNELLQWVGPIVFVIFIILIVLFAIVVSIASIVLSVSPFVALAYFFSRRSKEAKATLQASQSWSTTTGKVIKSRVEVQGGNYARVSPRVVYEYAVNNQLYRSEQIKAGDKFLRIQIGGSRAAYDTVDRYLEGATVTVYYDPNNPSEAALER
jgi:hypothetical protein